MQAADMQIFFMSPGNRTKCKTADEQQHDDPNKVTEIMVHTGLTEGRQRHVMLTFVRYGEKVLDIVKEAAGFTWLRVWTGN